MSTKRGKVMIQGGILSTSLSGTVNSIVFQKNGRLRISSSKKRRGYIKVSEQKNDTAQKD